MYLPQLVGATSEVRFLEDKRKSNRNKKTVKFVIAQYY